MCRYDQHDLRTAGPQLNYSSIVLDLGNISILTGVVQGIQEVSF